MDGDFVPKERLADQKEREEAVKPGLPIPYLPVPGMTVLYIHEDGRLLPAIVASINERKNLNLIVFAPAPKGAVTAVILYLEDVREENEYYPTKSWRFPDFVSLWQRPNVY